MNAAPLTVAAALERILARCRRLPAETVALDAAAGRVLADDVHSDLDLPPFDNSAMDGYAVRSADLVGASEQTPVGLRLVGAIVAGPGQPAGIGAGECAKIMTGAPFPPGSDAMEPLERVGVDGEFIAFRRAVRPGANLRPRGDDLRCGELVLPAGTTLGHVEIALLAAVGQAQVAVVQRPRAVIVSTGDELVDVSQRPGPGQLRDTTVHALPVQLRAAGATVVGVHHAVDSPARLRELFGSFADVDLVITGGGVSMGDRDFVRPVFGELGEVDFWRVALKPGQPLLFGQLGAALFFGLPGNPVSSMVTLDLFVRPAIDALLGRRDGGREALTARAAQDLRSDARRSEYVRVVLYEQDGQLWARPTGDQSSGRLTSLRGAMAYAVVPAGVAAVAVGEPLRVERLAPGVGAGD
ncbi:MAG: molybdopterin molybdotransferase MoeA [Fimbriimonadaceae bacterium]|nr:molybdopterin molybdotransferase MoeA [Fimbriimonadaceae bacterium]